MAGAATETWPDPATVAATRPAAVPSAVPAHVASATAPPLASRAYAGDFFTLSYPDAWHVVEPGNPNPSFSDATGDARVEISALYLGYPLTDAIFDRLVDAREANHFGRYQNHLELARVTDPARNVLTVEKQLDLDADRWLVRSAYYPAADSVAILDFWTAGGISVQEEATFALFRETFTVDGSAALGQRSDGQTTTFPVQDDHLALEAPIFWEHRRVASDNSVVHTLTSPDGLAIVQAIFYDDGEALSRTIAGRFVLDLLRDDYAPDLIVASDDVLADGRERLVWRAASGAYEGETVFGVDNTLLYAITTLLAAEATPVHEARLDAILESFAFIP